MSSHSNILQLNSSQSIVSIEDIEDWLIDYVASLLEVSPNELDPTVPFDQYGLDSSAAIGLTGDMEDWLGMEIEPTLLYDYPTIVTLAKALSLQQSY